MGASAAVLVPLSRAQRGDDLELSSGRGARISGPSAGQETKEAALGTFDDVILSNHLVEGKRKLTKSSDEL